MSLGSGDTGTFVTDGQDAPYGSSHRDASSGSDVALDVPVSNERRIPAWSDEEPRLVRVMVRPRWVLLLVFALAVAGVFAYLGHWQLSRSVIEAEVQASSSETVMPLADVVQPGADVLDSMVGQRVSVSGTTIAANTRVIADRMNDGDSGYWVVGSLTQDGDGPDRVIAIAYGWSADRATADTVAGEIVESGDVRLDVVGRLALSEPPAVDEDNPDPFQLDSMSVAALINQWVGIDGAEFYSVYVIDESSPDQLVTIESPPPVAETTINWLNIFYAAEWVIFAGFAIFLWFRLVRDAREREIEDRLDDESATAGQPATDHRVPGHRVD